MTRCGCFHPWNRLLPWKWLLLQLFGGVLFILGDSLFLRRFDYASRHLVIFDTVCQGLHEIVGMRDGWISDAILFELDCVHESLIFC